MRDGLQSGQEDNDVITHPGPDPHEDQARHGQVWVTQPALDGQSQLDQEAIEQAILRRIIQPHPHNRDGRYGGDGRQEERRPENAHTGKLTVEQQGDHQ